MTDTPSPTVAPTFYKGSIDYKPPYLPGYLSPSLQCVDSWIRHTKRLFGAWRGEKFQDCAGDLREHVSPSATFAIKDEDQTYKSIMSFDALLVKVRSKPGFFPIYAIDQNNDLIFKELEHANGMRTVTFERTKRYANGLRN